MKKSFRYFFVFAMVMTIVFSMSSCQKLKDKIVINTVNPATTQTPVNVSSTEVKPSSASTVVVASEKTTEVKPASTAAAESSSTMPATTSAVASSVSVQETTTTTTIEEKSESSIVVTQTLMDEEGKVEKILETVTTVPAVNEALKETTKSVVEPKAETPEEIVYDTYNYGAYLQVKFAVGDENAVLNYKSAGVSFDDIEAFISSLASNYPQLATSVVYSISEDEITFSYPADIMGGREYKEMTIEFVKANLDDLLNNLTDIEKIVKEEVNGVVTYNGRYVVYGKEVSIAATTTEARISYPVAFTDEELLEAREILLANNEELSYVQYSFDNGDIVLNYPEVTEEYIKEALASIDTIILAYTPMPIMDEMILGEPVAESVSEPVFEVATETVAEEKKPAAASFATEPKVAPATEAGEKIMNNISIGFNAGYNLMKITEGKGFGLGVNISYDRPINDKLNVGGKIVIGSVIALEATARYELNESLYAFGGAGLTFNGIGVILEGGIGYTMPIDMGLALYGEASLETFYNGKFGVQPKLSIGTRLSF